MMKKTVRNGLSAAVLTAMIFLLVSCGDLSMLMAQLDDDVKLANDRYLEVVETFPEQNDQNLSPKIELLVSLDRDVDPEALRRYLLIEQRNSDGDVTAFGDSPDITEELAIEFSSSDKTLSIRPSPFWAGGDKITVSLLPGAMALDGSVLRDLYSWSFYTVKVPVGTINFDDGPNAQPGYSNTATPKLTLAFSNSGEYHLSTDKAEIDLANYDGWPWQVPGLKTGELIFDDSGDYLSHPRLPNTGLADGEHTYYVVYKDPATNTVADYNEDTVTIDTSVPSVSGIGSDRGPLEVSFTETVSVSESGTGLFSSGWKSSPGGIIFGSPGSITSSISGPSNSEGIYTISYEATDLAGNTGSDSFVLDWDNLAPNKPVFTQVPSSPTTDNTPFWNWNPSTSKDAISPYYYRLYYNTTTWSTTANSYLYSGTLNDGYHRFDVGQYDDAGHLSYSTDYVVVNVAQITPYDTQTNVSTTKTYLDWPSTYLATYSYKVYREAGKLDPLIASGSTGTSSRSPTISLSSGESYRWYYYVTTKAGTVTRGPYYFATSTIRF